MAGVQSAVADQPLATGRRRSFNLAIPWSPPGRRRPSPPSPRQHTRERDSAHDGKEHQLACYRCGLAAAQVRPLCISSTK
jgi:hypothetical protein